jgi:hypothetical protein
LERPDFRALWPLFGTFYINGISPRLLFRRGNCVGRGQWYFGVAHFGGW